MCSVCVFTLSCTYCVVYFNHLPRKEIFNQAILFPKWHLAWLWSNPSRNYCVSSLWYQAEANKAAKQVGHSQQKFCDPKRQTIKNDKRCMKVTSGLWDQQELKPSLNVDFRIISLETFFMLFPLKHLLTPSQNIVWYLSAVNGVSLSFCGLRVAFIC